MNDRAALTRLADRLTECRDALDRAIEALSDEIDTTPQPLTHWRYANELHGNEVVERSVGVWDRVLEVVHGDFHTELMFADGAMSVPRNSAVHVRSTNKSAAQVRAEIADDIANRVHVDPDALRLATTPRGAA